MIAQIREGLIDITIAERRKIIAIIPAYNEERFIGSVVLKACRFAEKVIVVDDGSVDSTAEIASAAGALVVRHEHNQGKGAALNTGFHKAREFCPDAVVMLDADGQHLPEELSLVVEPVLQGQADIVVGSRYLQKKSDVPRHRVYGHWAFNFMTSQASGVFLTDSQNGFRAFSAQAMAAISFSSRGFSVESEMQFIARDHNLRIVEVPITIRYTDRPKRHVMTHGMKVLNGMLRLIGQYRPLLFFGVPGMVVGLFGVLWGLWVVDIYRDSQELAVGYALISMMLVLIGVLSLFTGITLHSVRGLLIELVRKHIEQKK